MTLWLIYSVIYDCILTPRRRRFRRGNGGMWSWRRRPKVLVPASVFVWRGGHRELQGEVVDQGANQIAGGHRRTVSTTIIFSVTHPANSYTHPSAKSTFLFQYSFYVHIYIYNGWCSGKMEWVKMYTFQEMNKTSHFPTKYLWPFHSRYGRMKIITSTKT